MRVNIVYEVNNREFNNCVLLQRELIKRGHKATIYNKTEDIVLSNEKALTIIPNSYRNEDIEYYDYVFNIRNNPLVVYHCEQVNNHVLPEFYDYSADNVTKKLPHLCWGEDYYRFIKDLGYDMSMSSITGAIQLDYCRREFKSLYKTKKELARMFGIPENKTWVLFISDFVFASSEVVDRIRVAGDWNEDVLKAKHSFSKESCSEIIGWFDKLLADSDEYVIIYRKHPMEMLTNEIKKMEERNRDRFFAISEFNIKEWIMNCDIISAWYSTAVVECYAAGKKMILLRPKELTQKSGLSEYEFFKHYDKVDEYHKMVDAFTTRHNNYNDETIKAINRLYSTSEVPAVIRVADKLEEIYDKWESGKVANGYDFKRWIYLFKHKIPFKIIIKKVFQMVYPVFFCRMDIQKENRHAVGEWVATLNNKKSYNDLSIKIDRILTEFEGDNNV